MKYCWPGFFRYHMFFVYTKVTDMHPVNKMADAAFRSFVKKTPALLFFVLFLLFPASLTAITLDECIHAAIRMNPGLEAATHRIKAARAAHQQARAAWFPHITASGNYTRTNNPAQAFMMELNQQRLDMADPAFDPTDADDTHNIRLSLGMAYLLYDGGRSRLGEQAAQRNIEISNHSQAAARNDLVYEVTRGYYNVLKAEDFISVFQETADSIEKSLHMAQERYNEGLAVKTDVLNLEVQLAEAQEDLILSRNNFHLALTALNTTIGADIVDPDNSAHPLQRPREETVQNHIPERRENQSINSRPELQAAVLLVQAKKLDLSQSRRTILPQLTAFGALDMDRHPSDNFEESYVVGVMAQWNIFDGFARSGTISEAGAHRREAVALLKQVRKQLELDLKRAELQVLNASQRVDVTRKALASAEESLNITRERYENGAVEITALLSAQTARTSTAARNRAAFYDYLEALANMDRATGKVWSPRH